MNKPLSSLQQNVFRELCRHEGKSVTMNHLAKSLKVSLPGVKKALLALKKKELVDLIKDKESLRWAVTLSDNPLVKGLKRSENLKELYTSGFVQELYSSFPGSTIILFGSYAHGEDTFDSDIDLVVIGEKEKKVALRKSLLKKEINYQFFPSVKQIPKPLLNNILNGITLKGVIELP